MDLKSLLPAIPALYYGWRYYCFSSQATVEALERREPHALSQTVKGIVKKILNPSSEEVDMTYHVKEYNKLFALTEGFRGDAVKDRVNSWIDSPCFKVIAGRSGALPLSSLLTFDQSNKHVATIFINDAGLKDHPALSFAVGREVYHILHQTSFHITALKLALAVFSFVAFSTLKQFARPSFLKYWSSASLLVPFSICQIAGAFFSLKREIGADMYAFAKLEQKFPAQDALGSALYFLQRVVLKKSESLWERFKFFVYQPAIETRMVYLGRIQSENR